MTYTSFPFDQQDTTETQYSKLFSELQNNGVADGYAGTGLAIGANSSAMSVTMQPGAAIVRGFMFNNDAVATLPISASGTTIRYDAIILRCDPSVNSIVPVVVKSAGLTPVLTQVVGGVWEHLLAVVTVQANAVTIAAADVADKRHFARGRIGVWKTTNRPASPRPYDVGITPDVGNHIEMYDPVAGGWINSTSRYWGTLAPSAWPTVATGALFGDTLYNAEMGCTFVFNYANQWLQNSPAICTDFTAIESRRTAFEAAGGILHNGFQAYDNAKDRLWVANGLSGATPPWNPAGGNPSTTLSGAAAITMSANWTLNTCTMQNLGNGLARIFLDATRATVALTFGTNGDCTNVAVGTVAAGWECDQGTALPTGPTGRMSGASFGTGSRVISLASLGGSTDLAIGEKLSWSGLYPLLTPYLAV